MAWLRAGALLTIATILQLDRKRQPKEPEHPFGVATSLDEPLSLHKKRAAQRGRGRRADTPGISRARVEGHPLADVYPVQ